VLRVVAHAGDLDDDSYQLHPALLERAGFVGAGWALCLQSSLGSLWVYLFFAPFTTNCCIVGPTLS
jgi:hypothetical protein